MNAKTFEKRNLSDWHATEGAQPAPCRAYIYATGFIANARFDRPLGGVASAIGMPCSVEHTSGTIWKYVQNIESARKGAVIHSGGAAESGCYANI